MTAADTRAALGDLRATDLAASLPDLGDALASQLQRLSLAPDIDDAAAVAANLEGARRAVLRLREALAKEQGVTDAPA